MPIPALAITMSIPPNRSMPLSTAACIADKVAHVGDDREHAILAESRRHLLEQHLVEVGQHQLGALVVQAAGHFRADTVGATGDQGDFSVHRTHGR